MRSKKRMIEEDLDKWGNSMFKKRKKERKSKNMQEKETIRSSVSCIILPKTATKWMNKIFLSF